MPIQLSKLLTLVFLISGGTAFGAEITAKFNSESFGLCLAGKMLQKYTLREINSRLDIDKDDQKQIVLQEGTSGGPSYFFEYMASIGLVGSQNKIFPSTYSEIELYKLFSFYKSKIGAGDNKISASDFQEQSGQILVEQPPERRDRKTYSYKRIQLHFLANPIIAWLMEQPNESVSQWRLLNFASELLGGDPITALAVIREMFYEEATYINSLKSSNPNLKFSRSQIAMLGKKMAPLFTIQSSSNEQYDQIGANYHFWHYLTLKIRERGHLGLAYGISLHEAYAYKGGFRGKVSGLSDKLGLDTAWSFQVWLQQLALNSSKYALSCSLI